MLAGLSRLVPQNIQFNTLTLVNRRDIKMTGVVSGEAFLLDINLSQFMLDLEANQLFKQVQLSSKSRTSLQGETVLEFELACITE